MELKEDRISLACIKQYLRWLLKSLGGGQDTLEFRTIKGWLFYSLSLVAIISIPCVIVLVVTGLLSGEMSFDLLLMSVSIIPLLFILPSILLYTFFYNYRRPKQGRKQLLLFLNRYDWDGPIRQMSQTGFECMKNNYLFRTDIRIVLDDKKQAKWIFSMIIPYYLPVNDDEKDEYIQRIDAYLAGKSLFFIQTDMAYFAVPVKIFPKLNVHKDIEQLLYIMERFQLHPCTFYAAVDIFNKVPVTPEILALSAFGQNIDQRCQDWAANMLEAGFINENMKRFQQQTPLPDNQIEMKEQLRILIREFNLDIFALEMILSNYIRFLLAEEKRGERSFLQIIQCLSDLYLSSGVAELLNFNLLYKAKIALDETGEQNLWTEAVLSVDNVDSYIQNYLQVWIEIDYKFEPASGRLHK